MNAVRSPWKQLYLTCGYDSTAEVAEAAGLDPSTLHRILAGSRPHFRDDTCRAIAAALSARGQVLCTPEQVRQALQASVGLQLRRGRRKSASSTT